MRQRGMTGSAKLTDIGGTTMRRLWRGPKGQERKGLREQTRYVKDAVNTRHIRRNMARVVAEQQDHQRGRANALRRHEVERAAAAARVEAQIRPRGREGA